MFFVFPKFVVENWSFETNNVVTLELDFFLFQRLLFFVVFVFLIDVGCLWLRINLRYKLNVFSENFPG